MSASPGEESDLDADFDAAPALARVAQHLAERVAVVGALWVVAPGLEDHAHHLAVEFVHPASVGAGSVAAVAFTGECTSLIDDLRRQARPSDVVVSLGAADSGFVAELSLRTQTWGVSHVHIGWSPTAAVSGVDPKTHVIRLGNSDAAERLLTRAYHLLWELTFICMQNGSVVRAADPVVDSVLEQSSCSVCSDEATIAEVRELISPESVRVATACGPMIVDVSLVDAVRTHDLVLAHAGVAIRKLPAHEILS
jgi:hypothetical protein